MGYNDAGELLPFQGGHNEMVANGLYEGLNGEDRKRLRVHYYVAKDQVMPVHNKFKARSCHSKSKKTSPNLLRSHSDYDMIPVSPRGSEHDANITTVKLMIVDSHLGIQGNGNQDTQSWFHSMEVNIMIDSRAICNDWLEQLRRNQNTQLYGMASQEDGIWRDEDGKEVEGAIGKDPGKLSWVKGVVGAVQRVRGAGGF
jgi:hypothetical protein